MKILAIEKENSEITAEQFTEKILKDEAIKVWELHQNGVIRELYFNEDEHKAVLIMECNDVNEAKEILKTFPLVKEGLISFEVIPLIPYDGFARLFS
ncbi:MAG: hypothetical protein NTX22_16825 [Ignavibacteriales bacterium]|nr:hypothetical protein [Ignavibacteriales bacterium]